ncbi:MAG: glycoside hydrolase family 43 protein, partial [Oligoflexia bacterium]|nr:glycoside hydrolase family 43 protein [Oligoflexia bacterium]
MQIINPILTGFNPDPSIIRVDDDFYIATSTFEWFPGVQIHHSKDLVNWRLLTRPLRRKSQLDMMGEGYSMGVWAPCLSYSYFDQCFYLVYTDAKQTGTTHNYLVTTSDILGEWSDPIYLNSRGFDSSLFHDDDGKKWIVQMYFDHIAWSMFVELNHESKNNLTTQRLLHQYHNYNKDRPLFKGILLQEYDSSKNKLVGDVYKIFDQVIGITEGPHLYKKDEYYYLLTAEGGTGFNHSVTMARAKKLTGPYEIHPHNPILSSKNKKCVLQKAGHADLVELKNRDVYMVHLCSRPLKQNFGSVLGRETAIQKMRWGDDGWLHLDNAVPAEKVPAPDLKLVAWPSQRIRDDFDEQELGIEYQWLRGDILQEIASLSERPGYLRLKGKEMVLSRYKQSLIARRQQSFCYQAITAMEFEPDEENQMAGLIVYYCEKLFYYLYLGFDQKIGKFLSVMVNNMGDIDLYAAGSWAGGRIGTGGIVAGGGRLEIDKGVDNLSPKRVYLKAEVNYDKLQFFYSFSDISENDCKNDCKNDWNKIGEELDMTIISDEHSFGFTGAFIGICCHDP